MSHNETQARGTFDAIARTAETSTQVEHRFRTPWHPDDAASFLGRGVLADPAGQRILDAGCGVGTYLAWLVTQGAETMGIDLSFAALRLARTAAADGVPVAQASVAALPCRASAFDAVVCMGVVCYVPAADVRATLAELCRVTRPGGEILLHIKNPQSLTGLGVVTKTGLRRLQGRNGLLMYYRSAAWYRARLPAGARVVGTIGWGVIPLKSRRLRRFDRWLLARIPALHRLSSDMYMRLVVGHGLQP